MKLFFTFGQYETNCITFSYGNVVLQRDGILFDVCLSRRASVGIFHGKKT